MVGGGGIDGHGDWAGLAARESGVIMLGLG